MEEGAIGACGVLEFENGRVRKRVESAGRGRLGLHRWNCSMRSLYAAGTTDKTFVQIFHNIFVECLTLFLGK